MPIITSTYTPTTVFKNAHFSTIYAGSFRKVKGVYQKRERITLKDGDFLDLDWSIAKKQNKHLVIILHGLEGNAQRPYILGSVKYFNTHGFDACAVNYRYCSQEINRYYKSYHGGAIEDIQEVISHIEQTKTYTNIVLKGFSLGGNLALKYLGSVAIPSVVKAAVAVSTPCNLYKALLEIEKPKNKLYAKMFKKTLLAKLKAKQKQFPDKITRQEIKKIKSLQDYDQIYTAQAHGFKDAMEYYQKSSCLSVLENIRIPTLILNAKNDSFLSKDCYPKTIAKNSSYIHLEIPRFGGHVGFFDKENVYYNEKRALHFSKQYTLTN